MHDYNEMVRHAASWNYWELKNGPYERIITKTEIDHWIMNRYGLEHADARAVSNGITEVGPLMISNGEVYWVARFALVSESEIYNKTGVEPAKE